ncbi:hypothetical protein GCM10027605_29050 [Micromonospora zhanjiangensis]
MGVDQAGQQGPAGAVDLHVGRPAVRLDDPVAVDEHVGAFHGALPVEYSNVTDHGTHCGLQGGRSGSAGTGSSRLGNQEGVRAADCDTVGGRCGMDHIRVRRCHTSTGGGL